jgi:Asp-tRNA(Asn)/Glu-tRNA(Gln) amidotransferase A subunit family amidase
MGAPEMEVPAGYIRAVLEPKFVLSDDKATYESLTGTVASQLPKPMPISMMLWGAPGSEPELITVASAYEAATHHRVPPPDFPPLAD